MIAGFDLGVNLGYAVCNDHAEIVVAGKIKLPSKHTHEFERYAPFVDLLYSIHEIHGISHMAIEQLIGGPNMGGATAKIFWSLRTIFLQFAYKEVIHTEEVHVATLKKFSTGNGKLTNRSKEEMFNAAVKHFLPLEGMEGKVDDIADAIHVARWYATRINDL